MQERPEDMEKPNIEDYQAGEVFLEELRHYHKMQELRYKRSTIKLEHDWAMERHRIENAEKKKRDRDNYERERELIKAREDL